MHRVSFGVAVEPSTEKEDLATHEIMGRKKVEAEYDRDLRSVWCDKGLVNFVRS